MTFYVIGNGSNLLVGDKGFRGVIFKICKTLDSVQKEVIDGETNETSKLIVKAGAGIMLAKLAKEISFMGYKGFEVFTVYGGTFH